MTKHDIEFKTIPIMESFPKELGKVTDPANFWVMSHDTYEHKSQLYFLSTTLEMNEDLPLPLIAKQQRLFNNRLTHPKKRWLASKVGSA